MLAYLVLDWFPSEADRTGSIGGQCLSLPCWNSTELQILSDPPVAFHGGDTHSWDLMVGDLRHVGFL